MEPLPTRLVFPTNLTNTYLANRRGFTWWRDNEERPCLSDL